MRLLSAFINFICSGQIAKTKYPVLVFYLDVVQNYNDIKKCVLKKSTSIVISLFI